MPELAITRSEKMIALTNALLAGLSVGAGVGVTTYSLVTTSTIAAGLGAAVSTATAPFWIIGACSISGVIALGVGVYAYKEYIDSAEKLIERNKRQEEKKAEEVKKYLDLELEHLIVSLSQHFFSLHQYSDMNMPGLSTHNESNRSTLTSSIADKLLKEPRYYNISKAFLSYFDKEHAVLTDTQREELLEQKKSLKEQLYVLAKPELDKRLAEFDKHVHPKTTSYRPAVTTGVITAAATFSTVLATAWGITALVAGSGLAIGVLATPVGLGILLGGAALGLVIGATVGYYKYKNAQRQTVIDNKKAETKHIREKVEQLESVVEESKNQLRDVYLNSLRNKVNHLESLQKTPKTQSLPVSPSSSTEKLPSLPRAKSFSEGMFSHGNDPQFEKKDHKEINQKLNEAEEKNPENSDGLHHKK